MRSTSLVCRLVSTALSLGSLGSLGALGSCAPEYDPTRTGSDPGTFGQRVVTLMCKRLAFQADPTDVSGDTYREACRGGEMPETAPAELKAIAANRPRLVAAIDHIVPADVYDPLQAYLTSPEILALYDDDTMSASIASLGAMMQQIGGDTDAMAAFSRMGVRAGYRPVAQAVGPVGPLTGSPHIRDVMSSVLPSIIDGGSSKAQWDALVAAIGATLADAGPQTDGSGSTAARIANDFLLTEQADLGEATPLVMVRRDVRGVARVALVGGVIPAPFSDGDDDKLADLDAQGNFVDAAGAPLAAPTPFPTTGDTAMRDVDGRAVDAVGAPVYEYFDVTRTLLGAMSNDQVALLDPAKGTAIDLVLGASFLLGERTTQTRTFDNGQALEYRGYDTTASPLLDMAHAFTQVLRDPNILDTLALNDALFDAHQPVVARLLEAAIVAARMGDEHPEAEFLAEAPVWDELRPHLQKITSNPKLMRDLLVAMEKPEVKQLISLFRDQMKYSDRFDIAPDQTLTGSYTTVVDRTAPDSGANRSVWQRLLHVISDTNGAVECSKAGAQIKHPTTGLVLHTFPNECDFFRVPNMAVFYLQSIVFAKDATGMLLCETTAGAFGNTMPAATPEACVAMGRRARRKANFNYQWPNAIITSLIVAQGGDAYLETRSTIQGQRTFPTPEGLNRVLFLNPRPAPLDDTSEPAHDRFGSPVREKHGGSLPVWEVDDYYNKVRPILQAFADVDQEQIFVDLLSVLHKHWSTKNSTSTQHTNPSGPNYTAGSNGVSYEPLLLQIFEGDLWPTLTEHAAELNAITVRGKPYTTVVANAGRFLITPLPGLADRLGNTTTTTVDGKPVTTLSPWHLIADAYRAKRARLAGDPARAPLWIDSTRELVDILFRSDLVGATWTFRSPHMAAATRATTKLLRDRIVEHDAAGDRAAWLSGGLRQKLLDFLTHPMLAAVADFLESQTVAGAPRMAMDQLLLGVFDGANNPDAYATMRIGACDLIQLAPNDLDLVPLAHMVGGLLAPTTGYLATQLALLHRMHQADTAATLTNVVARLFKPHDSVSDPGIPAISAIADGVGDVDRGRSSPWPGPPATWSQTDYGSVFQRVGAFLTEQQRGMPRFITIIKGRTQ